MMCGHHRLRPLLAADQPSAPPPVRNALHTIDIHISERIDQARLLPKAAWKLRTTLAVLAEVGSDEVVAVDEVALSGRGGHRPLREHTAR